MEFLNGFTTGTENNPDSKGLILLVLIAVLVLGFGKDGGLNFLGTGGEDHGHHHGGHRKKACNSPG